MRCLPPSLPLDLDHLLLLLLLRQLSNLLPAPVPSPDPGSPAAAASGALAELLLLHADQQQQQQLENGGEGAEEEAEEEEEEGGGATAAAAVVPGLDRAAVVAALLPVWVERVLGAKERPAAGLLAAWGPLLAAAPEGQLSGGGGGWVRAYIRIVGSAAIACLWWCWC